MTTRNATRGQTRQNPSNDRQAPATRRKKNQAVYFKCRYGNFVLESAGHKIHSKPDGTSFKEKTPDTVIWFTNGQGYHIGYSRGYDPTDKDDARVIKLARKLIAEGKDERVRICGFAEEDPHAPRSPAPNWDEIAEHRLLEIVRDLGLDLDKCIAYEEYYGARPKLMQGLQAMKAGKVPEDPLTVPSA